MVNVSGPNVNGAATVGPVANVPLATSVLTNPAALRKGISQLKKPNIPTMIGLYTDSIIAGTGASDITTACVTRFTLAVQDAFNTEIGGSAKCGRGRFGPFHHNATGAVTGTAGPIIIGASSGWVRGTSYYTSMFWEDLNHPGSVTPGAGTNYAGCYMVMNPTLGWGFKWVGMLANTVGRGKVRVQFRQGATAVVSGTTGTNRYTLTGGVPNPGDASADIKLDVTLDFSTYDQLESYITGHLNSVAMDPTSAWAVCLYRPDNAATSVSIQGFDGHRDEYSAQNTPSVYGAVTVADFTRPGKTSEIFMSGSAIYGTNGDYGTQTVTNLHINTHARAYSKYSKRAHSMPIMELAITNFGRNDKNLVDGIASYTPTDMYNRWTKYIVPAFTSASIPLMWICDWSDSSSYVCSGDYINANETNYVNQAIAAVATCSSYQMTAREGGGLTLLFPDVYFGTGGPRSYACRNMFSSVDALHQNDYGNQSYANLLLQCVTNPTGLAQSMQTPTTRVYDPSTVTTRAGVSKTTVLELDPNKFASVRMNGAAGFLPYAKQHNDVTLYNSLAVPAYDGSSGTTFTLNQSKSGAANTVVYNIDQFEDRAGLFFDNAAASLTKITFDLTPVFTSGLTQVTIFFVTQNFAQTTVAGQQHYWHFGTAADTALNSNTIYQTWSGHSVLCGAVAGLNSGQMMCRVGNQVPFIAAHEPGSLPVSPSHVPMLGCITFDCTTKQVRTVSSPNELAATGWKSSTSDSSLGASWQPTALAVGGLLGTGASAAPAAFGGMWVINGIVTDAEYKAIYNTIYAESGGFFYTGTTANNDGGMNYVC